MTSQSFHMRGFPATQVFERAGLIADPMYHDSGANYIVSPSSDFLSYLP
jgi:hypothetical protein